MPERYKPQFEDYLKRVKEHGKDTGLMNVMMKDGRERIVEYRNSLVYDSTGPIGVRGSARDITEAKRAEVQLKKYSGNLETMVEERTAELKKALHDLQSTQSQLLQSEKMASIGQLAAGVAHEINNPVGFVKSNLGTMNEYLEDLMKLLDRYRILEATLSKEKDMRENETLQRALDDIKKQEDEIGLSFILDDYKKVINESLEGMARVEKIVSDLKDFAHVDKAELEHADLNHGIKSTLNIVWNELKYKAQVIKDLGRIPSVKCYPQRLNQVFMNILVNAAQAIEDKGEIRITTRADNGYVEIRISDSGKGIPSDVLPKIFDPFFTTKEVGKGTGLGLSMAYNIIQRHKGTIDVDSEVGKGTTFTIRIPVETDA
jgi:signal transduction histidine kinase